MTTPLSTPPCPKTALRRVAILFSGGPAPAANAVIASAAMCFARNGIEVLGILNGYSNLIKFKPGDVLAEGAAYLRLDRKPLEGKRNRPGIMIGTARANPGKSVKKPEDLNDSEKTAPLQTTYDALRSLDVDALISIGGDDTLTTAAKFKLFQDHLPAGQKRIQVIHLPKTIDNDYRGIDFTFGYFTAVEMMAQEIYNLLMDGNSTGTYYLVQAMGRRPAGWPTGRRSPARRAWSSGLEDIPEAWKSTELTVDTDSGKPVLDEQGQPLMRHIIDVKAVVNRITDTLVARDREKRNYGVIVVAEGVGESLAGNREIRECVSESAYRSLKPDTFGHFPVSQLKFSSRLGQLVADEYKRRTGKDRKIVGLQFGYEVRCHKPTAFDVILGSQLGVGAYRALAERNQGGVMISVAGQLNLVFEPFENLIDYTKLRAYARPIDVEEGFHQLARYLEASVSE